MHKQLEEIVESMAEGLVEIDQTTEIQNSANPETSNYGNYLKGVGCLGEHQFRDELTNWWNNNFDSQKMVREIKYPENGRLKCDIGLTNMSDQGDIRLNDNFNWVIELKYIRFIGDNGKVNNYGLGKVVSPYKAEHSSVGDAIRLSKTKMGKKKAIVMYGFEFDELSVNHCRQNLIKMELEEARADEMEKAIRAGTHDGKWDLELIGPIFEASCQSMGIKLGKMIKVNFSNLERHPNYRIGKFLAWEVIS
jgi:hypothetical protein